MGLSRSKFQGETSFMSVLKKTEGSSYELKPVGYQTDLRKDGDITFKSGYLFYQSLKIYYR